MSLYYQYMETYMGPALFAVSIPYWWLETDFLWIFCMSEWSRNASASLNIFLLTFHFSKDHNWSNEKWHWWGGPARNWVLVKCLWWRNGPSYWGIRSELIVSIALFIKGYWADSSRDDSSRVAADVWSMMRHHAPLWLKWCEILMNAETKSCLHFLVVFPKDLVLNIWSRHTCV